MTFISSKDLESIVYGNVIYFQQCAYCLLMLKSVLSLDWHVVMSRIKCQCPKSMVSLRILFSQVEKCTRPQFPVILCSISLFSPDLERQKCHRLFSMGGLSHLRDNTVINPHIHMQSNCCNTYW